MVEALLSDGYRVAVYDIDPARIGSLVELGAQKVEGLKTLAGACNVLCTSLPNDRILREALLGQDGALSSSRAGSVVIELSTVDPETVREVGREAARLGLGLLDVPVSGSPKEAQQGELILFVGGEREVFETVQPLLNSLGSTIQHVGEVGDAKTVKIVNNMMTMANVLAAAEAFSVGVKAGIEPELLFTTLSHSGGRSHHFVKRFPKVLSRDFRSGFPLGLGEKDLRLALELASRLCVPTPTISAVRQLYSVGVSEGLADSDIVSIIRLFERWAGTVDEASTDT